MKFNVKRKDKKVVFQNWKGEMCGRKSRTGIRHLEFSCGSTNFKTKTSDEPLLLREDLI